MSDLFSADWMDRFKDAWNADPELAGALGQIGFNSVIAYGIDGEDAPRGVLSIENGHVTAAGAYSGETVNWDLRASADQWNKWMGSPPNMMGLGMAYTTRKLKFKTGDYGAMIKDPRMAKPFVKSFSAMGRA
ncbi:MAG: SCP-2 sterol transfer family protein [Chromatiales bacterium]|nr:SCP-2 sterol transfer family protein [Chromatiales bacterium]